MREIKFRGRYYREKNALYPKEDRWVYGSLVVLGEHYWIREKDSPKSYLVISKSVGQYTGLKDKNGKEIYEFDIILFTLSGVKIQHTVEWDKEHLKWAVREKGFPNQIFGFSIKNEIEIIGNIYENPELLKE